MPADISSTAPARAVLHSARSEIDSFIVMDVMRRANAREAAGERVIHMEVGQPGTPAPPSAREAAVRAVGADRLGYTDALGMPALRERIARHYRDWHGLDIAPDRVVVTTGSSAGFVLAFLALFDAGARVGLPSPGYPCYRQILRVLGLDAEMIATHEAPHWMPDAAMINGCHRERALNGLLLASPANPTGTMLAPEQLAEIVGVCRQTGIRFISDEIYHGLSYAMPCETALAFGDDVIVINSFSKYFSMTGWRIGWMVVPDALVRTIERLAQNLYISAPAIAQHAALGAFEAGEQLEAYKEVYRANRALFLEALPAMGLGKYAPGDGAFYFYCDVSERTDDSLEFARRLLDETGVAVTPGLDFDPHRGHTFIRLSYARATDDICEGLERLSAWLR